MKLCRSRAELYNIRPRLLVVRRAKSRKRVHCVDATCIVIEKAGLDIHTTVRRFFTRWTDTMKCEKSFD